MTTTRILVVDDDPVGATLLARALDDEPGFEVEVASDGGAAISAIEAAPPDLVLLDLVMPGLDGHDVVRNLRGRPETRDIPVIVVTASDRPREQVRALDSGADDLLTKPYRHEELMARVRVQLRHRARADELGAALDASQRRCRRLRRFGDRRRGLAESVVAEMRAAVSAMQLHMDALDEEVDVAERERLANRLNVLHKSVSALGQRAAELADVSGLEPVSLVPRAVGFAPGVMIAAWLRELAERLDDGRGIEWQIDDPLPDVHTDPQLLQRALRGVVLHAGATSRPGATVAVAVTADAAGLVITIDDADSELPPRLRRELLDSAAGERRGSDALVHHGVGLTFSRLAADLLGGGLAVEAGGAGQTRYRLRIPVAVTVRSGNVERPEPAPA